LKLSISNIAWPAENNDSVYKLMKRYGFTGLEIAPTIIFPENPYEQCSEARKWNKALFHEHAFSVSSMQSIWYGRQENIFSSAEERSILLEYTKKAIDFASDIKCRNLVFGCPKNRNVPAGKTADAAPQFFFELGEYAISKGTVIALEPNPPIYNTNYINDTEAAFDLVNIVDSSGFKLNLDVGTMIYNREQASLIKGRVSLINHVHISEPGLLAIKRKKLHEELAEYLNNEEYGGFVSIEMGKQEDISVIENALKFVKRIFK